MPIRDLNFLSTLRAVKAELKNVPTQAAAEAEAFFKDNFKKGGFQGDNGLEPWAERKDKSAPKRGILVGKAGGHLRRGVRKFVNARGIGVWVTGSATRYADVHNFGGTITVPVTSKMRSWAWAMWFRTKRPMYKAIALTKKEVVSITMPPRKFIGNSKQLDRRLNGLFETALKKAVP